MAPVRPPPRRLALALAAALLLPALGAGSARATELRLLTYNTHGLPAWISRDDPEARFPEIGAESNRYDVVLLQEDFAHHERLRETVRHPIVLRGNPSRMPACPICSGSGLTTLVRKGAVEQVEARRARSYATCSGWLGGANDCLATKGFLHARLRLAGGATLHVVNTHLDAGRDPADREARRAQLETLADALERETDGEALVVAGDLNLDDALPEDRALLETFRARLGLRDAGARPDPDAGWEVIDYVLVRSGASVRVTVLGAGEDRGFARAGRPLSDHPALFVRLRVEPVSASSTSRRPPGSPPR
jgi:endonuclease/exonuclease/phosphatase family metal-dependent hydrolase